MDECVKPIFIDFDTTKRVLVMSDTHGNYHLVNELLKRNHYNEENDYLLILGDLAAKGPYPLKTLRYFMELSHHQNVYIIMGNCDESDFLVMEKENLEYFKMYLEAKSSLPKDMLLNAKEIVDLNNKSLEEIQMILKKMYQRELDFLRNLPHVIISKDYIFTHAKIPLEINLDTDSYKQYVGGRSFYKDGHSQSQVVIAGHMPVTIFRQNETNDNILFLTNKKMILIDGGMIVKKGGQINLLAIDLQEQKEKQLDYIDELEKRVVIKEQISHSLEKGTSWPFYKIKVLEEGLSFSKCLITETLEIASIKNEYINNNKQETIDDCPAGLINVKAGDIVSIIDESPKYHSLVKMDGRVGWLKKENIGGKIND